MFALILALWALQESCQEVFCWLEATSCCLARRERKRGTQRAAQTQSGGDFARLPLLPCRLPVALRKSSLTAHIDIVEMTLKTSAAWWAAVFNQFTLVYFSTVQFNWTTCIMGMHYITKPSHMRQTNIRILKCFFSGFFRRRVMKGNQLWFKKAAIIPAHQNGTRHSPQLKHMKRNTQAQRPRITNMKLHIKHSYSDGSVASLLVSQKGTK